MGRRGYLCMLVIVATAACREPARKTAPSAEKTLPQRCDDGELVACNDLGVAYSEGNGVAKDRARARQLFESTCQAGLAKACTNLGYALRARCDAANAQVSFQRACSLGEAVGCDAVEHPPAAFCAPDEADCTCPDAAP